MRVVEQAEEGAEHALLEGLPLFTAQERRPVRDGQAIGLGDLALATVLGNLAQPATADFPQLVELFDQHALRSQYQLQGLARAWIAGAHGAIEHGAVQHTAKGRGLIPARQRQRHEARVERTAIDIEVIDVAMPHQIAAAAHHGNGFRHGPAPWDC
ncbi:hypothetical protein FQZ97_814970 [compost metagenome]